MLTGATYRLLVLFDDTDRWTFTNLCQAAGYPTELGAYYIRRLIKDGYLQSVARGEYAITPKGSLRITITNGTHVAVPRPRLIVVLVPERGREYVVLRRKIQPFIGKYEWPGGAIEFGESLPVAADRMVARYFDRPYTPTFVGFFRKTERYDGSVFDDKLLAVYRVQIPAAHEVQRQSHTGMLECYSKAQLRTLPQAPQNLLHLHAYATAKTPQPYAEYTYELSPEDFLGE